MDKINHEVARPSKICFKALITPDPIYTELAGPTVNGIRRNNLLLQFISHNAPKDVIAILLKSQEVRAAIEPLLLKLAIEQGNLSTIELLFELEEVSDLLNIFHYIDFAHIALTRQYEDVLLYLFRQHNQKFFDYFGEFQDKPLPEKAAFISNAYYQYHQERKLNKPVSKATFIRHEFSSRVPALPTSNLETKSSGAKKDDLPLALRELQPVISSHLTSLLTETIDSNAVITKLSNQVLQTFSDIPWEETTESLLLIALEKLTRYCQTFSGEINKSDKFLQYAVPLIRAFVIEFSHLDSDSFIRKMEDVLNLELIKWSEQFNEKELAYKAIRLCASKSAGLKLIKFLEIIIYFIETPYAKDLCQSLRHIIVDIPKEFIRAIHFKKNSFEKIETLSNPSLGLVFLITDPSQQEESELGLGQIALDFLASDFEVLSPKDFLTIISYFKNNLSALRIIRANISDSSLHDIAHYPSLINLADLFDNSHKFLEVLAILVDQPIPMKTLGTWISASTALLTLIGTKLTEGPLAYLPKPLLKYLSSFTDQYLSKIYNSCKDQPVTFLDKGIVENLINIFNYYSTPAQIRTVRATLLVSDLYYSYVIKEEVSQESLMKIKEYRGAFSQTATKVLESIKNAAVSEEIQSVLQEALTPLPNLDPYNPALFTASRSNALSDIRTLAEFKRWH